MTEEHQSQLAKLEEAMESIVGRKLFRYGLVIVISVATCTASVIGAYCALKNDNANLQAAQVEMVKKLDTMQAIQTASGEATIARIVNWSQWRVMKDAIDDNYERRMAWLETVERNRRP